MGHICPVLPLSELLLNIVEETDKLVEIIVRE